MSDIVIELGKSAPERPSDSPRQGDRRICRLVPTPWNTYAPCLWRGTEPAMSGTERGRWCVVLIEKGNALDPKPQTVAMFVPDVLWDKLPTDVVEW